MKFAIDIGYGDTKVAFYDKNQNIQTFKFPSLVEKVSTSNVGFMLEDENIIEYEGNKYRVGNDIVKEPYSTRDVEFLLKFSPLLIYKAMKIISEKGDTPLEEKNEIYTGISIFNWNYSNEFANKISNFTIDGMNFKNKIVLYAQGQGIFINEEKKLSESEEFVIVFDGGYNTNDIITFRGKKPIKEFSFASQNGIYKIIEGLQQKILEKTGLLIDEYKVQKAFLKKKIKFKGDIIDLSDEIRQLKKDYFEKIFWELKIKLKDIIDEADQIILSGGGAYYIEGIELPKNFSFGEKPYEFENVLGYLKGA